MLEQAVAAMEGHTDLMAQLADAWLMSANLKQFDLTRFYANVARSRDIAGSLDDECMAVLVELRALQRQRDQAGWFEARAQRAHRFADRAAQARGVLQERLTVLAQARRLDSAALIETATRALGDLPVVDALPLVDASDDCPQSLGAWLP